MLTQEFFFPICSHNESIQCLAYNPVTQHLASCTSNDFGKVSIHRAVLKDSQKLLHNYCNNYCITIFDSHSYNNYYCVQFLYTIFPTLSEQVTCNC